MGSTLRSAQAKQPFAPVREPYRTLRGWALGVLLETHAIKECEEHGHMKDRTDPDAWKRARHIASSYPLRGVTPAEAVKALDDVMQSIGDTCPDCKLIHLSALSGLLRVSYIDHSDD
jgi:hypothetical protein